MMLLMLLAPFMGLFTALNAKKTNAAWRARRAAKLAAQQPSSPAAH